MHLLSAGKVCEDSAVCSQLLTFCPEELSGVLNFERVVSLEGSEWEGTTEGGADVSSPSNAPEEDEEEEEWFPEVTNLEAFMKPVNRSTSPELLGGVTCMGWVPLPAAKLWCKVLLAVMALISFTCRGP